MDEVKQFMGNDRLARHLGIDVFEQAPGRAQGRMVLQAHHLNAAGTVHGGAIFTLANVVFAAASNSHGTLAVAISASISFFQAVSGGTLTASAEEVSFRPKLATYLITVCDDNGSKIALFHGTVYRKKERLPIR